MTLKKYKILAGILLLSKFNLVNAYSLQDLNQIKPKLDEFGISYNDVAAVIAGAQYLTFGIGEGSFLVTDFESAKTLVDNVSNYGLDSVASSITGNYLVKGSNTILSCSGNSGSYDVSNIQQAIGCLGLDIPFESFKAANAAYEMQYISFYMNRPTTVISNALRDMRVNRGAGAKGGASGDSYSITDDLGVYFNAGGSFGDVNAQNGQLGFGVDNRQVTLGVDYRFNDFVSAGFLYGYMSNEAKIAGGSGAFYSDIFRFMPFLSITPIDNAYIDFTLGYGLHDNQSSRACLGCGSNLNSASKADEYLANLNLGYSYTIDALTLTGHAGASGVFLDMSAYSETGVNTFNNALNVRDSYNYSVTNNLGVDATYAFSTPYGVILPRIFGEWVHEHANDAHFVRVDLQGSNIPSVFSTPDPVRDWGNVGFGAQMILPNSISVFTNFQSLVMKGATNHTIEGGVRLEF